MSKTITMGFDAFWSLGLTKDPTHLIGQTITHKLLGGPYRVINVTQTERMLTFEYEELPQAEPAQRKVVYETFAAQPICGEGFDRVINPTLSLFDRELPHLGSSPITFTYTNWKGEVGQRRAIPLRLFWGSNQYHSEPQWLLEAHDLDKDAHRTFAMKDMRP